MKNKSLIGVIFIILAIVLGTSCKKKVEEPVVQSLAPAPPVEKPLSIDQQMQKAVEAAAIQEEDSYVDGNKTVKKWEIFNSWDFIKPFQEKYLFDISYELPESRTLLPVGVPFHPEDPQTVFLFYSFKDDPGKFFVPYNAIVYWGTYKDGNTLHHFAWGGNMEELPLRNK